MRRAAVVALLALALAGCGGSQAAKQPAADPKQVAVQVLGLIVHNHYTKAWDSLHPDDQAVAPRVEYVSCESKSPVQEAPTSVTVVRVKHESVGIGDGTFRDSTAVDLRLDFPGGFHVVQTVHLIAADGMWKWILPPAKYRAYKADACPGSGAAA